MLRGCPLPTGAKATAAGLLALVLYVATMAPGVYWGDSAQLQIAAAQPTFSAGPRDYPLWTVLAAALYRLLPATPALAANLLSALVGAAAVGLIFLLVARLASSDYAASISATALAVAHLVWSSAVVAEVYSLALLLLLLLLLAARASLRPALLPPFHLGLVVGLCLLHHRMLQVVSIAILIALAISWWREKRLLRTALAFSGGALTGALPLLLLLFLRPPSGHGLIEAFFLGPFRARLPAGFGLNGGLLSLLLYELRFLVLNLPGPQFLCAVLGAIALRRCAGPFGLVILALALAGVLEVLAFPHIGDRYVLLLPTVLALAVLAGLGAERLLRFRPAILRVTVLLLTGLLPVLAYRAAASQGMATRFGFFRGARAEHARNFFWPPKMNSGVVRSYAEEVFAQLPEGAHLVSDWGEAQVFRYLQEAEGRRTDLRIATSYATPEFPRCPPTYRTVYPLIPANPEIPVGHISEEVLPGKLWRIDPAGSRSQE